jgi:hypothetical protein
MSEHKYIAGVLFFVFFEIIIFSQIAIYNAEIVCPELNVDANQTNSVLWLWNSLGLLFSPCSGLPWWVYTLIFAPLVISLIGYLTPFIG